MPMRQGQISRLLAADLATAQGRTYQAGEVVFVAEKGQWYKAVNDGVGSTSLIEDSAGAGGNFIVIRGVVDFTASEPTGNALGDAYINTGSGNSSVTSQAVLPDQIRWWNAVDWSTRTPLSADLIVAFDGSTNAFQVWDGTAWSLAGGAGSSVNVVADITARDALSSPGTGDQAYVQDASGDATVAAGAALYVYDGGWQKIAEFESLDVSGNYLTAADITARDALTGVLEGDIVEVADIDGLGRKGWYIWDGAAYQLVNHERYFHNAVADLTALSAITERLDGDMAVVSDADGNGNLATYIFFAANGGSGTWAGLSDRLPKVETGLANAAALTAVAGMRIGDHAEVLDSDGNGRTAWYVYDGTAWDPIYNEPHDFGVLADATALAALTGVQDGDWAQVTDADGVGREIRYLRVGSAWEEVYVAAVDHGAVADAVARDALASVRDGDTVSLSDSGALQLRQAGAWITVNGANIPAYSGSTQYYAGDVVVVGDKLRRRIADGISGASFNATEAGFWDTLPPDFAQSWQLSQWYDAGDLVEYNGFLLQRNTDGSSLLTFDDVELAQWTYFGQKEPTPAFNATLYYPAEAIVKEGDKVLKRIADVSVPAAWGAVEATNWDLLYQTAVSDWAAGTTYMAGEKVRYNGSLWQKQATGLSNATAFNRVLWLELASGDSELLHSLMPYGSTPVAGTGVVTWEDSPWGLKEVVRLSDDDAATVTVHEISLGSYSAASGDTFQRRIDIVQDTAQANHVISVKYTDDGGNSGEEFFEVGNGAAALVAGGTDAGNLVLSGSITEYDRGSVKMLRIDLVETWSGASGANPKLQISPVYNLDGSSTADPTATGSLDLEGLDFRSVAEFAIGQQEMEQQRIDSSSSATIFTLDAATGANPGIVFTNASAQVNSASLAVQSGESLNGVTDGVFYFSNYGDRTQFLVTSPAAGEWAVSVMGASSFGARQTTVLDHTTEVTLVSGATSLVFDTTALAAGTIAINGLSYYDEGSMRYLNIDIALADDNPIVIDLGSNAIPAGATIDWVSYVHDGNENVGGRGLAFNNITGSQFYINKANDLDGVFARVTIALSGVADGHVVLAGMVEPGIGRVTALSDDLEEIQLGDIVVRTNSTEQQFQIKSASGAASLLNYRAYYFDESGNTGNSTAATTKALTGTFDYIWQDNTLALGLAGGNERASFTLDGEDYVIYCEVGASWTGNIITIEKVQQSTVVMPDAIEVATLYRAKMTRTTAFALGDGTVNTMEWESVEYDNGGAADLVNDRFNVPADGVYQVHAQIPFAAESQEMFYQISIRHNGSAVASEKVKMTGQIDGNGPVLQVRSPRIDMSAGDTVDLYIEASGTATSTFAISTQQIVLEQCAEKTVIAEAGLAILESADANTAGLGDDYKWLAASGRKYANIEAVFAGVLKASLANPGEVQTGPDSYAQVFTGIAGPNASTTTVAHGITGWSSLTRLAGRFDNGSLSYNITNGVGSGGSNDDNSVYMDATNFYVSASGNYSAFTGALWIEYTK